MTVGASEKVLCLPHFHIVKMLKGDAMREKRRGMDERAREEKIESVNSRRRGRSRDKSVGGKGRSEHPNGKKKKGLKEQRVPMGRRRFEGAPTIDLDELGATLERKERARPRGRKRDVAFWVNRVPPPEPKYDIAVLTRTWEPKTRFETEAWSVRLRDTIVRSLMRLGGAGARALAKKLKRCKVGKRCGSGACPICCREFRRWWVAAVLGLLEKADPRFQNGALIAVNLVRAGHQRAEDELLSLDLKKLIDVYRKRLRRAGFGDLVIVGGVDFSFNTDSLGRWSDHWCGHLYIIVGGIPVKDFKKGMAEGPSEDGTVVRPRRSRVVEADGLLRAISYSWKTVFERRNSFRNNVNDRVQTKSRLLRHPQLGKLALCRTNVEP
jgi:hypothetical protein